MTVFILALFLLIPSTASALTIAIGTPDNAEAGIGTPNTISLNYSIPSDHNLVCACLAERDTNASNFTADTAALTVGGQSMTQIHAVQNGDNLVRSVMMCKHGGPTGTQTITGNGDTGTDRLVMAVISFKNAAASSTFNTPGSSSSTAATNADVTGLASAVGEVALACGTIRASTSTPSPDATVPVSVEQRDVAHTDATSVRVFMYTEDGDSPTIDMRVDLSGSERYAMVAASIRPAADPTFGMLMRRTQ